MIQKKSCYVIILFFLSPLIALLFYNICQIWQYNGTGYYSEGFTVSLILYHGVVFIVHIINIILCVSIYYHMIKNRIFVRNNYMPYICMFLFSFHILFVTLIRGVSSFDLFGHIYSFESVFSFFLYPVIYFYCGSNIRSRRVAYNILLVFMFVSVILNTLQLFDIYISKVRIINYPDRCSVFHNSNHYGYFLAMSIILSVMSFIFYSGIIRYIFLYDFIVSSWCLIINNTLGAWLACSVVFIVSLVLFVIFNKSKVKILLSMIFLYGIITIVFSFIYHTIIFDLVSLGGDVVSIVDNPYDSNSCGSGRWGLWINNLKYAIRKPFSGYGVEGLCSKYGVGTPHNEIIQYLSFYGIPSFIYYIGAILIIYIQFIKYRLFDSYAYILISVSLVYFISSLFGVTFYYTTPFMFIFLGMSYGCIIKKAP